MIRFLDVKCLFFMWNVLMKLNWCDYIIERTTHHGNMFAQQRCKWHLAQHTFAARLKIFPLRIKFVKKKMPKQHDRYRLRQWAGERQKMHTHTHIQWSINLKWHHLLSIRIHPKIIICDVNKSSPQVHKQCFWTGKNNSSNNKKVVFYLAVWQRWSIWSDFRLTSVTFQSTSAKLAYSFSGSRCNWT